MAREAVQHDDLDRTCAVSGLSGRARLVKPGVSVARRAGSWLGWWVVLMAVWVIVDNSVGTDELVVGAGAAAVAAILIEVASYQAETRFGVRLRWLAHAARLPGQVAGDTLTVFAALGRRLHTGAGPRSGFITRPVNPGPDTPEGRLRRALLIGAESMAPNKFALGIDADRGVMVVHKLVLDSGEEPE